MSILHLFPLVFQVSMSCELGEEIPDFELDSQLGMIRYHDLIDGKLGLLITIGSAFDPVTTTEIGALHKLSDEFEARNISVSIIGCDNVVNNRKWIKDIDELQGVTVKYPIISDTSFQVLKQVSAVLLIQHILYIHTCWGITDWETHNPRSAVLGRHHHQEL